MFCTVFRISFGSYIPNIKILEKQMKGKTTWNYSVKLKHPSFPLFLSQIKACYFTLFFSVEAFNIMLKFTLFLFQSMHSSININNSSVRYCCGQHWNSSHSRVDLRVGHSQYNMSGRIQQGHRRNTQQRSSIKVFKNSISSKHPFEPVYF